MALQYLHPFPFPLESGETLSQLSICYHTIGTYRAEENNAIWICHALTANSEAADWWSGVVGAGKPFDPKKHFIVCANVIGSCYGSTGPLSLNPDTNTPYYHAFPLLTIRDMAHAHELLRQHLGINKLHLLIGGSLGGQQASEWAIEQPDLADHLILIATNAHHSPWGVAFNESQRMAIAADQTWAGNTPDAGLTGLKAARAMALLSYRHYEAYRITQSEPTDDLWDDYLASSYQNYQGEKLAQRFNAYAYWTLSKAMDSHHVGRNRGGIDKALKRIKAKTLVVGISSDLLFPCSEQKLLADKIPEAVYKEIHSDFGHDGFLVEWEQVNELIREALKTPPGVCVVL